MVRRQTVYWGEFFEMRRAFIWMIALVGCGCGSSRTIQQSGEPKRILPELATKFINAINTRYHERIDSGDKIFDVWRDGDKVAANLVSRGKLIRAYRFDGKDGTFYEYNHDLGKCLMKLSKTGENFALANREIKEPSFDSIDNLEALRQMLADPKSTIKATENSGITVFNQTHMVVQIDPKTGQVLGISRPTLNGLVTDRFDYPENIDPEIFKPSILPNFKVFKYEDDKAAIENSLKNGLASKTIGTDKVTLLGCFHVAGTGKMSILWNEFEKSKAIERTPLVTGLLPQQTYSPYSFQANRGKFHHLLAESNKVDLPKNGPIVFERYFLKDELSGGYTVLVTSDVGKTVDLQIPAVKRKLMVEVKDLQGKPRKLFNHKIEYVKLDKVPVTEVYSLDPLYDLCTPPVLDKM